MTTVKRLRDFVGETVFEGLGSPVVVVAVYPHESRRRLATVVFSEQHGPEQCNAVDAEALDLIDKCLGAGWVRGSVGVQYDWRVVS